MKSIADEAFDNPISTVGISCKETKHYMRANWARYFVKALYPDAVIPDDNGIIGGFPAFAPDSQVFQIAQVVGVSFGLTLKPT